MQESLQDVTRGYVALDLPDGLHCTRDALPESSSVQYWDPPSHVQMTSVVGHARSPSYGTQSIASAVDSDSLCALMSMTLLLYADPARQILIQTV